MRGAVVDLDGETQTVIGGKPELSDVATQTVIGLICSGLLTLTITCHGAIHSYGP